MWMCFFPGFISDTKRNFRNREVLHIEIWTRQPPYVPSNLNYLIILWFQSIPKVHLCHSLIHWINVIHLFARPHGVPQVYSTGSSRFQKNLKLILFHGQPHGGRGPDKQKGRYIKNRVTFNARTVTQWLSSSRVRHYQRLCQRTNSQAHIFKFTQ